MRRTTTALVAVMLVVGTLAVVPMAGLGAQATETTTETNSTDANTTDANATAPGEQLAGVVGVQEAEIEGEVDSRAYGIRVAQAASNDSKAAVVGDQLADVEGRLDELEERRASLEDARENGSMSEGQYRARMAKLNAETQTVERLANQSNETAQSLPAETLEANGVNASAIESLRNRASELSGPEVAEIARSIAGESAGNGFGPAQAAERGPDRAGDQNETDDSDRAGGDDTPGADTTTEQGQSETAAGGQDAGSDRPTDTTETGDATETDRQESGNDRTDAQDR